MKSQTSALLHVTQGLIKDILVTYPALKGMGLDLKRLTLYCQTRGLTLFTLDLPNLHTLLLRALESGRLQLEGPLSSAVSKKTKVPRLFSGLWLRVFDKDACLKTEADVNAIFFLECLCTLGSKIAVDCSSDRVKTTMENYYDIEDQIKAPTLRWDCDDYLTSDIHINTSLGECCRINRIDFPLFQWEEEGEQPGLRRLLDNVQQVADILIGSFDHFNASMFSHMMHLDDRKSGFKHGLGAVSERLENSEKSNFPNWPDKLEHVYSYADVATTTATDYVYPSRTEVASRLICVPKTAKGPRLIAAEPTSHMWCQQGMRAFLEQQLSRSFGSWFIDFKNQQLSGNLVLKASLDRKLATVDLSDASDRLSCWTVERIFRSNKSILDALHAARTRLLEDNISQVPKLLFLKKFATQGTATTFPVQSIVFLCIALGCCLDNDISIASIAKLRNQVRVFGDDIIIPRHGYVRLCNVMHTLGLKVNVAKSYINGHFRESCGTNGFRGYDVTPVKPKTLVADSPASCQAVVDTSNNLFNKGLWYASDSCRQLLPARFQRGIRIVAINETGFAGLTSFSGSDESHLNQRYNSRLHRYEVRVFASCETTRYRDMQGSHLLLDFVSRKHNHEHARIVSKSRDFRKSRGNFRLLWEPLNTSARVHIEKPSLPSPG